MDKILQFCNSISYNFKDPKLLEMALTHPSVNIKNRENYNYERLEFLGDKVLSFIIAEYLISKYPHDAEGLLSKRHASLVSGKTLANIANKINLHEILILSFGERKIGGNLNKNNLENALEALIGAIYIDGGIENVKKFVFEFWQENLANDDIEIDYVSQLQELIQGKFKKLPIYNTLKKGGTEHQPIFISTLMIEGMDHEFHADGNSKKQAQKNVAKTAFEYLKNKLI
jgi:ribonuclease-3